MKKLALLISLIYTYNTLFSQITDHEQKLVDKTAIADSTSGWKKGGLISVTINQVSLTNWAAGGVNSLSAGGFFNVFANYKKNGNTWDNNLDLAYGILRQGNNKALWLKNDDRIDFTSKYGRLAKNDWYFAMLINFRSQFSPGYANADNTNKISDLFSPAYLLGALGMDYKPNENLYVFIAPLTSKTTIVSDQTLANAGAYGVDKAIYDDSGALTTAGKNIRNEFGGYMKIMFQKNLMQNINFQTKLDLFSNYLHNPQNIDINWQTMLTLKVNDLISATLSTHMIYDDDINISVDNNNDGLVDEVGPRTQFKQTFGAGLSFKF